MQFVLTFFYGWNVGALRSAGHLENVRPGTEADVNYKS